MGSVDEQFVLGDTLPTLRGSAASAHDCETVWGLFASYQALPAPGFTVFGAEQAWIVHRLRRQGMLRYQW